MFSIVVGLATRVDACEFMLAYAYVYFDCMMEFMLVVWYVLVGIGWL